MSLYSRVVFPRLCDLLLGGPAVGRRRRELLGRARGEVLEVGFGSGLNLPHYPDHVRRLAAVDPNPGMLRLARRRAARSAVVVEPHACVGEHLPFGADSFDTVVSTFTLCSVEDVGRFLAEVHRVLRPGGQFLFLEHGLSPDPGVRRWQFRLDPLEAWLAEGCRLTRDMGQLIAAGPFAPGDIRESYLPGTPWTHGYLYQGFVAK